MEGNLWDPEVSATAQSVDIVRFIQRGSLVT